MLSPARATSARIVPTAVLIGLALLAFALRVYRLDGQSMWGDEMWSLFHASQRLISDVLRSAHDDGVVPPAYYLILHFWTLAAGQSEFAIRYASVFFGALTVPTLFALGRRLGGAGTGIVAALLQTLSPFHVYYSQEARMYALMIFFTVLSTHFFWRLFAEKGSRSWKVWAGYVIASGLAVNSHYFAWYVILAHGLLWLGDLVWRRRAAWHTALLCLGGQVAALILFLPWLVYVWDRALGLSGQVQRMSVPLSLVLRRCLSDFSAGVPIITSGPEEVGWIALAPFLLLLVLALLWPWRRRSLVLLIACLSVPTLATFLVSFPTLRGWTRYFIAASPSYYLLLARGVDGVRKLALSGCTAMKRKVALAVLITFLVLPLGLAQARSLHRYYTDPTYWRWDYRGQYAAMAEAAPNNAAIVHSGAAVSFLFKYYLPPGTPYTVVPSVCDGNEERIRQEIATIATAYEQIWLVREVPLACDENHRAAQWLKEHTYQVSETALEDSVFDLYLTPATVGAYRPSGQPSLTFGGRFKLVEFALSQERVAPGGALAVALRWLVLSSMDVDYKFFLIVLGPNGEVFAQRDGMPLNWLMPTTIWEAGEDVDDRWGMMVGAHTPLGTYPLYVGAYDPTTGVRLPLQTAEGEVVGDMMLITEVEVR
jgi:mannosyltransferase